MPKELTRELVEAASAGDLDGTASLLDRGADPNDWVGTSDDESDRSVINAAVAKGNLAMVELLLRRGANPNPPQGQGRCPLTQAMCQGDANVVELLYRYGGKANLLLGFCFMNNLSAICEILHREPQRWGEYALDSIRSGNVEMLADNLGRNPSLDVKNAFVLLRSAIFQWRLVHRFNIEGFDRTRYQTMTRMLLEWGVDPNLRNAKGQTNLHMCATYGRDWSPSEAERVGHAKILLEFGADINARDQDGNTPLASARKRHHDLLASFLERAGAV